MKKNTKLLILLIVISFVSGGGAGFFAGYYTAKPWMFRKWNKELSKKDIRKMILKHFCKRLKLKEGQEEEIKPLLSAWLDKMEVLREKHAPEYKAAFEELYSELAPKLTEEQLKELDSWRERHNKRHSKFFKKKPKRGK